MLFVLYITYCTKYLDMLRNNSIHKVEFNKQVPKIKINVAKTKLIKNTLLKNIFVFFSRRKFHYKDENSAYKSFKNISHNFLENEKRC